MCQYQEIWSGHACQMVDGLVQNQSVTVSIGDIKAQLDWTVHTNPVYPGRPDLYLIHHHG